MAKKNLNKQLDKLASQAVKLRDNYTCRRCGKKAFGCGCHWAHVYGCRRHSMRWNMLNALTLCAGCHRWTHSYPMEFQKWFWGKWPHLAAYLRELYASPRPVRDSDKKQWIKDLKEKIEQLKGDTK